MKTLFALAIWALAFAYQSNAEVVTLRGGAVIEAPLLKKGDGFIVIDLGHDVITLSNAQILDIHDTPTETTPQAASPAHRIYQMRHLDRMSTEDAAKIYAPEVVVVRTPGGLGSGFFVNKDGYLITNFHVIKGQKRISVTQFVRHGPVLNRTLYEKVDIIATDPFHDLAVLQIKREDIKDSLQGVVLAPHDKAIFGESVFVIGNPLGLERTVTKGVLSQVGRNFGGELYLQVDASVNPGNSGGPLFNERGQVIGVINMGIPSMQGLNFAIPVRHVKFLLENLDAYAYDQSNPESGFVYPDPPPRFNKFKKEY